MVAWGSEMTCLVSVLGQAAGRLGQPVGQDGHHHRVESEARVAAEDADVLVQRRVAVDRGPA